MKDIGKFVGSYFYLIAFLQIIASIYGLLNTHEIQLDLSFVVYIIIGYFLIKHNNKARKLVLFFSGLYIILSALLIIIFTFTGINGMFHIDILGMSNEIRNLKDLYSLAFIPIILAMIPFLLLRSKRAIKEFENKVVSA